MDIAEKNKVEIFPMAKNVPWLPPEPNPGYVPTLHSLGMKKIV